MTVYVEIFHHDCCSNKVVTVIYKRSSKIEVPDVGNYVLLGIWHEIPFFSLLQFELGKG